MKNFQITSVEDGKKYWIARSISVSGVVMVDDNGTIYVPVNQRGSGTPSFKYCWCIPGGYLDWDESVAEGMSREMCEEQHIWIEPSRWTFIGYNDKIDSYNKTDQNVCFRFIAYITKDEYDIAVKEYQNHAMVGENDEVTSRELMKLSLDELDKKEWAFNHKEILTNYIKMKGL